MKRFGLLLFSVLVLAFGLACLNYTRAEGLEHHADWAAEHGLPAPGPNIFFAGVGALAVGTGALGFLLGRRRAI